MFSNNEFDARPVRCNITFEETSAMCAMARAKITAIVAGTSVEVRMRLTFRNPHPRKIEGQLIIPLPETATVCDFGTLSHREDATKENETNLDDDANMMWASVVAKETARVAFETEVR